MTELVYEDFLKTAVELLVRLVESAGAVVIFIGAAIAFVRFLDAAVRHRRSRTGSSTSGSGWAATWPWVWSSS